MPLTNFTNSRIIAGTRTATRRSPDQQAARDKIVDRYAHPDKKIDCPICGYMRLHIWDGAAYVCGCGSVVK